MSKYTTISAKISEKESEEIKKLKLNLTMIIRKAVQDEIKKAKNEDLIERMKKSQAYNLEIKDRGSGR